MFEINSVFCNSALQGRTVIVCVFSVHCAIDHRIQGNQLWSCNKFWSSGVLMTDKRQNMAGLLLSLVSKDFDSRLCKLLACKI